MSNEAAERRTRIADVLQMLSRVISHPGPVDPSLYIRLCDLRLYTSKGSLPYEKEYVDIILTPMPFSIQAAPIAHNLRSQQLKPPMAPTKAPWPIQPSLRVALQPSCWLCEKAIATKEEGVQCVKCAATLHLHCASGVDRRRMASYTCARCKLSVNGLKVVKVCQNGVVTLKYEPLDPSKKEATHASMMQSELDCRICLLSMEEHEDRYTLVCGHQFHLECLRQCVMRRATAHHCNVCTCPIDHTAKRAILAAVQERVKRQKHMEDELLRVIEAGYLKDEHSHASV